MSRQARAGGRLGVYQAVLALAGLSLVGCGGGGGGYGGSSGGMMSPPPVQATLDSIQANVFTPSCALSGCHAGGAAAQPPGKPMDLSAGQAFGNIVNVSAIEQTTDGRTLMRIAPNDPMNSYLFLKITGDAHITGVPMPKVGPRLSADQITAIQTWITNGAPNGTGAGGGGGGGGGY